MPHNGDAPAKVFWIGFMILSDYKRGLIVSRRTHKAKGSTLAGLRGITQSPARAIHLKGTDRYALVLWDGRSVPELVAIRVLTIEYSNRELIAPEVDRYVSTATSAPKP